MPIFVRRLNPVPATWKGAWRAGAWLAIILIAANLIFLGTNVAWPRGIEKLTAGVIPPHFVRQFDAEPLDSYNGMHGIAHNSGDSLDKIASAIEAGAHGIEIDVISYRGALYARHNLPVTVFGEFGFRPVLLESAWESADTELIQLDLKDTSARFLTDVASFLRRHQDDPRIVLVSSWDPVVLAYFQKETPWVGRLLSVGTQTAFDELQSNIDDLQRSNLIDGVAIIHDLLDRSTAGWLKEQDLLIFAWTVENLSRVNELTLLGVDAVVTDNLAILYLLRETQDDDFVATPVDSATPPGDEPSNPEPDNAGNDQGGA